MQEVGSAMANMAEAILRQHLGRGPCLEPDDGRKGRRWMFCKWCGLESDTTDACSWCGKAFSRPATIVSPDVHEQHELDSARVAQASASPDVAAEVVSAGDVTGGVL